MIEHFKRLPLKALRPDPNQPRRELESEDTSVTEANTLQGLAASIQEVGMLQPIRVREIAPGDYMIVSGQRRYEAARMLGLVDVPCIVTEATQDDQLRLISQVTENLQRKAMKASELALAVQALVQAGNSHDEVAKRLGIQNSQVTLLLNLLVLGGAAKTAFEQGRVESTRAAYDLNRLPPAIQEQLVIQAEEKDRVITQRDVRDARQQYKAKSEQMRHRYEAPPLTKEEFDAITQCLADGVDDNYDPFGDRDEVFGPRWRDLEALREERQRFDPAGGFAAIDAAEVLDQLQVRVPTFALSVEQVQRLAETLGWNWPAPIASEKEIESGELGRRVAQMLTQVGRS